MKTQGLTTTTKYELLLSRLVAAALQKINQTTLLRKGEAKLIIIVIIIIVCVRKNIFNRRAAMNSAVFVYFIHDTALHHHFSRQLVSFNLIELVVKHSVNLLHVLIHLGGASRCRALPYLLHALPNSLHVVWLPCRLRSHSSSSSPRSSTTSSLTSQLSAYNGTLRGRSGQDKARHLSPGQIGE